MENIEYALGKHFGSRQNALESNQNIIRMGFEWAANNLTKQDRYSVRKLSPLSDYILTDGNNAGALGALYGGVQFCSCIR
jgi:2-oxoglutarate ferredoxin oxidoreductase subunit alpha